MKELLIEGRNKVTLGIVSFELLPESCLNPWVRFACSLTNCQVFRYLDGVALIIRCRHKYLHVTAEFWTFKYLRVTR